MAPKRKAGAESSPVTATPPMAKTKKKKQKKTSRGK